MTNAKVCPYCQGPKRADEPSCRWESCEEEALAQERVYLAFSRVASAVASQSFLDKY